jgi:hypothetical protein
LKGLRLDDRCGVLEKFPELQATCSQESTLLTKKCALHYWNIATKHTTLGKQAP